MSVNYFNLPGVEWDEISSGISVFIPGRRLAELTRFLELVITQKTLDLVDAHQPDSSSRWTSASGASADGAFFGAPRR